MKGIRAKLLGVGVALALQFTPYQVFAEGPRVLLVYPAEAEPSVSAALVRVRGELIADGFDVVLIKSVPGTTSAVAMNEAKHDSGSATVGLFLNADGKSAELWVVDKLTDKTVVRHVETASEPTEQLSEVLAVRAVELLRASLLEFLVVQRQAEAQKVEPVAPVARRAPRITHDTAEQVSKWAARPLETAPSLPWIAEMGLGTFLNPGQIGPALIGVGRLSPPLSRWIWPRLSFVGLGTRPKITEAVGTATVQQWYGLGEVVVCPWPQLQARPQMSVGVGVQHINVDGDASWPYRGVHSSVWTFATDIGLGVALKLSTRLHLQPEGHVSFSMPYPNIRFVGKDTANLGRPMLVGSLTLAVSL